MSCLCILNINPIEVSSFKTVFSHSVAGPFVDSLLHCAKALQADVMLFMFAFVSPV